MSSDEKTQTTSTLPTKLIYLEDFNLLTNDARIVGVVTEGEKTVIILDQSIFYPQGGGQPYDKGSIVSPTGIFKIEEVRFIDGIVKHIGFFEKGAFTPGEQVTCTVDRERRILHSRLHSAGHVVDMAVSRLGLPWIPGKGYHFPDGPYVEYSGILVEVDKEKLKTDLEVICNKILTEDRPTKLLFIPKEEMAKVCRFVPDRLPEGKPARVVMFGDFGTPCGGTHVNSLAEIKSMSIRKIKANGENTIKVSYNVE